MQATAAKVLGPLDGKAGFLGTIGVRFTIDGAEAGTDVGGITLKTGLALGRDITLAALQADHDAVFLGVGLGAVNALGLEAEALPGVEDAVAFIARLRQAAHPGDMAIGRRVVVIGGGMTAIDIATQAKRLGAEEVTIVYRRGAEVMNASRYEQLESTQAELRGELEELVALDQKLGLFELE